MSLLALTSYLSDSDDDDAEAKGASRVSSLAFVDCPARAARLSGGVRSRAIHSVRSVRSRPTQPCTGTPGPVETIARELEDAPQPAKTSPSAKRPLASRATERAGIQWDRLPDVSHLEVPRALQAKVESLHEKLKQGHSVNKHIREAKMFRNPDLLEKLVQIFGVDQFGSNLSPLVFDASSYAPGGYYKALEERRHLFAAQRQGESAAGGRRLEFVAATHDKPELPAGPVAKRSKWDTAQTSAPTAAEHADVDAGESAARAE